MLGSAILVSSAVVHVRRKAFERRFTNIIEREREKRKARKNSNLDQQSRSFNFPRRRNSSIRPEVDGVVVRGKAIHQPVQEDGNLEKQGSGDDNLQLSGEARLIIETAATREDARSHEDTSVRDSSERMQGQEQDSHVISPSSQRIRFAASTPKSPLSTRPHTRLFDMSGVGAHPDTMSFPRFTESPIYPIPIAALTQEKKDTLPGTHKYFESGGFIGRNSQFHSLTLWEREQLGGVEYRAITLLEVIVPMYFILWQLLGCIGLGAWVAVNQPDSSLQNGLYLLRFVVSVV